MSFIVNIATDVGNGKINTGVNFYSRPISTRQVTVAAEELYTPELREYLVGRRGSSVAAANGERFTCVLALIMTDPTRGASVASAASSSTTGGSGGEKWQEFNDPSQLYPNCQLYVFDTNSPAPEKGIIPRALLVVDADRIPAFSVRHLNSGGSVPSASGAAGGDYYYQQQQHQRGYSSSLSPSSTMSPSQGRFGGGYQQQQLQHAQQQQPEGGYYPHSQQQQLSVPPATTAASSMAASSYPRPSPSVAAYQQQRQYTTNAPAANTAASSGAAAGLNTTAPAGLANSSSVYHQSQPAPYPQQPQSQQQQSNQTMPSAAASSFPATASAPQQQQQQQQIAVPDRAAGRQYLFRQLRDRCAASGQGDGNSIPAQALHAVLVQNEMFFPTETFAEITNNKTFITQSDWSDLEAHFAPILDVLFDRIAAKTAQKNQQGEEENMRQIADRMQNRLDELSEEEAALMAKQAAVREEMARLKRDLQRHEQHEKVVKDEKTKEWDVLSKYVTLKLRQHKLRREEEQINHQLSLL